jgi:two-component system chemotaxis response regulator CheY
MANILVVDDSSIIREELRALLESGGHTITEAVNGEVGFNKIKQDAEAIDCVITDLNMPVMSGLEMLEKVNLDKDLSFKGDIIMLTTEFNSIFKKCGRNCGVKLWLSKPVQKKILVPAIASMRKTHG